MTLIQRRLNVDATSGRCIDVEATLYRRHVSAGLMCQNLDEWRTVQTLIRRRVRQRLIRIHTVCSGQSVRIFTMNMAFLYFVMHHIIQLRSVRYERPVVTFQLH